MAYRNTFFRWLFLYSLTFGLTYVLKLFTYLCPETGHGRQVWCNPCGMHNRGQRMANGYAVLYPGFRAGL